MSQTLLVWILIGVAVIGVVFTIIGPRLRKKK